MSDELIKLQDRYAAQSNGEWEHRYGIEISTSDNPAWNVGVDLTGTNLDGVTMPDYKNDAGNDDWVLCNVIDNTFHSVSGPSKLVVILRLFFQLMPPDA